jgi:GntR family transcriptional regulator
MDAMGGSGNLWTLIRFFIPVNPSTRVDNRALWRCRGANVPFSNKPLYLQVRDALADLISRGTWKPGFQVPSELELAREMGVSSGTLRKALEVMEAQRLVVRRQGRGTFVNDLSPDEVADRYVNLYEANGERLRGQQTRPADARQCLASGLECSQLGLRAGADIYRIRRVREHRGEIFLLEDVVLPAELFPCLLDGREIAQNIGTLAKQYGILLGRAQERISVCAPPHDIAQVIGAPPSKEMLRLDRIVETLDGRPAEWRIAYCRADAGYYLAEMK